MLYEYISGVYTFSWSDYVVVVAGIETSELTTFSFDEFPLTVRRLARDRKTSCPAAFAAGTFDARVFVRFIHGTFCHSDTFTVNTTIFSLVAFTFCAAIVCLRTLCDK